MEYNFPVSLQPTYTKIGNQIGQEIPRRRAVVRDDTGVPIASVSTKYKLVTHTEVFDQALKYVDRLGKPQSKFYIASNGAKAVGEFTYADKTLAVEKGDLVGLRVYIESSYNAKSAIKVRIGGLQLKCMNGLMQPKDVFDLSVRHSGAAAINFPDTDIVFGTFKKTIEDLSRLTHLELNESEYENWIDKAIDDSVIPESALNKMSYGPEGTAWNLYSAFTHHITHQETSKATQIGKLNRLNRVTKWFDENFPIQ